MATGGAIAAWAAVALSAAEAYNQNQTMRKKDRESAQGIYRNMKLQREGNQKIAKAIHQRQQSSPAAARQSQTDKYLQQIHANQNAAQQRLMRSGLGEDYARRASMDAANENDYATKLASLMGATDAPSLQRQQEVNNMAGLGTDIGLLDQNAKGNNFLTRMNVRGTQANPWLAAAQQGLSAYAKANGG